MDKNKTYGVVAAVIVIIVIVAVAAWYVTGNDDGGSDTPADEGDTYYFYLDGFNDEINGWYSADADGPQAAFESAMTTAGIEYKIDEYGMITIEDFVSDTGYDEATQQYIGTGTSVFAWCSTSNVFDKQWNNYFEAGPVLSNVTSNIVYLSYSDYEMVGADTLYDLNPASTTADLVTDGPFAEDSGYEPLTYDGEFYFYLDGFNDEINGWYTATGDNPQSAFESAMTTAGIEYRIDEYGMITIEDFVADSGYDEETEQYIGTGTSVFAWCSTTNVFDKQWNNYFEAGPVVSDVTSNIIYLSYSDYEMIGADTLYDLNPASTTADLVTGGPFATA